MTQRYVAVRLKIPDNEAYTALTTLQRLGIDVARLERSEVYRFDDDGDSAKLVAKVERNETIFNPNKHALAVLDGDVPRPGETWIAELDAPNKRYVGWRLFDANGAPAGTTTVRAAVELLLCNPAIERPV
jgi:phosphoribosylformylglycinamidine (FGAM) synthase PurS component